jgi:hypothetical protein
VQREEAVERRIVDRKAAKQQLLDRLADPGNAVKKPVITVAPQNDIWPQGST